MRVPNCLSDGSHGFPSAHEHTPRSFPFSLLPFFLSWWVYLLFGQTKKGKNWEDISKWNQACYWVTEVLTVSWPKFRLKVWLQNLEALSSQLLGLLGYGASEQLPMGSSPCRCARRGWVGAACLLSKAKETISDSKSHTCHKKWMYVWKSIHLTGHTQTSITRHTDVCIHWQTQNNSNQSLKLWSWFSVVPYLPGIGTILDVREVRHGVPHSDGSQRGRGCASIGGDKLRGNKSKIVLQSLDQSANNH